ncbi:unnamed protein product [Didymodactylos carnosus]|uniref:DUF3987 domain-containing protein n=1 Tax=Didymodactylos carnosus TaxID=1234261 RepID=A0A816BYZ1_9BILA|nr:unnamed protein product [Didymodactylos carnosus]CAF1616637.1 unnamed protein product [Didymodactylos carnosus]CAF3771938.1 unnamed protein product [Didymodactylos carnosus]CAF4503815.1 unnamed protein product [Didymodactylos carnosus]
MSLGEIRERMMKAQKACIQNVDIFETATATILTNVCKSIKLAPEFLLTVMLPAAAHCCFNASVRSWSNYLNHFIIYSIICGFPCAGKSQAMRFVRKAVEDVEDALGINPDDSKNNNSATIESLIGELQKHSSIVQLWDELNTFLYSMGIYKSEKSAYDRSYFNTFFNGENRQRRQTCKNQKGTITKPRLNISAAGHPITTISSISDENTNIFTQDGLFARFIICAPKASAPLSSDFCDIDMHCPSLSHLLFGINQLHTNGVRDSSIILYFS